MAKEITVDGVVYVPKTQPAEDLDGMEYKVIRTYSAGVFAGYMQKKEGKEVTIRNARRLWRWSGAASLSQLATEGTNDPNNCKFPIPVDRIVVTEAIEILDATLAAQESIAAVPVWEM